MPAHTRHSEDLTEAELNAVESVIKGNLKEPGYGQRQISKRRGAARSKSRSGRRKKRRKSPDRHLAWTYEEALLAAQHDAHTLARLMEDDWLAAWQLPNGVAYTLTPWAASEKHMEIDELPGGKPFWKTKGRMRRQVRIKKAPNECPLPVPERVVDPLPGPEYLVDWLDGQTTRDEKKAATLFQMGEMGVPVPVIVDPRLAKRPKAGKRRKTG